MSQHLKQQLKYMLILVYVIAFMPAACAQEQVVINSGDWKDVYSSMMYANLCGMPASFITDAPHATALPNYLDKGPDILLVESETSPFFANYEGMLTNEGFVVSGTYMSPDGRGANLHFIGELPDITNFIVLDDSYGYNAISVAPYAVKSRSWVLFADHENIDKISGFLDGRTVNNLLIYGRVDRQVNDSLSRYDPEIIDYGDRFDNNIAIAKKYQDISEVSQIVFTNGEFIENEIMSGREPVLFIGTNVIPEQTVNYLNRSGIETGVVIGNALTDAASMITARTDMHVFIKFGQGRAGGGGRGAFSLVETLDEFPLPKYELVMSAVSVDYNQGTGGLEVVYQNDVNIDIFSKSSISVFVDGNASGVDSRDGKFFAGVTQVATAGDKEAILITKGTTSGVSYDCPELAAQESLETANITAEVNAVFGESPRSLNRLLHQTLRVGIITFVDQSSIDATEVLYTKNTERLSVTITNTGVPCYVCPDVLLRIGGREQSYRVVDDPLYLPVGGSESPSCRIDMTDADIADNPVVSVHVSYGEREKMLGKGLDKDLPLEIATMFSTKQLFANPAIFAGITATVIIAAAILLMKRRRE